MVKIKKMDITSGIRACYFNLMVLKRSEINKPPPLESKLECAQLVQEELEENKVPLTKAMAHEGEDYTKEKMGYIKLIKPYLNKYPRT